MATTKKQKKIKINLDASFFNEKYIPYLNRDERYNIFYGSAGSGKSFFLASKLVLDLMKQKQTLLVIRQTFASIRDSVFAEIISALTRMQLIEHMKVSQTTLTITFPNGSKILFKGADSEEKLLSISGIDMVWAEECSEISRDIFNQLEMRLRGGTIKKKFYLSFNPVSSLHWLKSEFFDNPKDDSIVCHSTYLDNRFIDQEFKDNMEDMKIRNPEKYRVYGLGLWGVQGKKVYENWRIKPFETHELVQENPELKAVYGLDFGYRSDAATLFCALIDLKGRKLYVFDEMYEHGLLNNQLADKVIEMGYSKEVIICDSAEKKSIDELKGYGLKRVRAAKKGAGSIMQGIQFLQQFEIIVHPNCIHTIDELENYSFKKDKATGKYKNEPVDNYNHILDAARYSVESFSKTKNKVKFISKSAFGL